MSESDPMRRLIEQACRGDWETRQGDWETGRLGDKKTTTLGRCRARPFRTLQGPRKVLTEQTGSSRDQELGLITRLEWR